MAAYDSDASSGSDIMPVNARARLKAPSISGHNAGQGAVGCWEETGQWTSGSNWAEDATPDEPEYTRVERQILKRVEETKKEKERLGHSREINDSSRQTERPRSLDARVAADMRYLDYMLTSPNADWIPQYPFVEGSGIIRRDDGFWGGHEYSRWPQFFSRRFFHHACISFTPLNTRDDEFFRTEALGLKIMYYDPIEKKDFVRDADDYDLRTDARIGLLRDELVDSLESALTLNTVKCSSRAWDRVNDATDADAGTVYFRCQRVAGAAIQRLRLLKMTWREVLATFREVQRAIMELEGLSCYIDVVVPRIKSNADYSSQMLNVRGAFTTQASVVDHLFRLGIPVWFICGIRQFRGNIDNLVKACLWSHFLSNKETQMAGKAILDGLDFRLDARLHEMSVSHFMLENHIDGLLDEVFKFQECEPGAPATRPVLALPSAPTPKPVTSSCPIRKAQNNSCGTGKNKQELMAKSLARSRIPKPKNEPYVNYGRILHIPNSIDGTPDLPYYHTDVLQCLKEVSPIPDDRSSPAMHPLPPPFLLVHANAEKMGDLYLNYIRIRPVLRDIVIQGNIFDKRVWRKLRDWRFILHGNYGKTTPLPVNSASPFVERVYGLMKPSDIGRKREHAVDPDELPLAKRQRVADNAAMRVVFGVERELSPFDRTQEQDWRGKRVFSESILRDKQLRLEVQWELSEMLFRYEFYALDQEIVPREGMWEEKKRDRNQRVAQIFSCRRFRSRNLADSVFPDFSNPMDEYWPEGHDLDLSTDNMIAFRDIISDWPDCPDFTSRSYTFRDMITFYVKTFVRYFNRMPTMHCSVPVSLYM